MSRRLHSCRSRKSGNGRTIESQVHQANRSGIIQNTRLRSISLILIWCFSFLGSISFSAHAELKPPQQAIASAHPYATQAGIKILNSGGNAFDAAIAVASVLAVVEPYSSGFGGGGFWLIHDVTQKKDVFIDGREKAPLKAHPDVYLDAERQLDRKKSINGPMAAGIPGQAAALVHLAENYGNLPLTKSLADAIHYSEKGFPVDQVYQKLAGFRLKAMQSDPMTKRVFLTDSGEIPELNTLIIQPELAKTLTRLAEQGHKGFYQGETAKQLVDNMKAVGGIWQMEDLAAYSIVEREPIRFSYQGHTITSAPPPSAGGIALAQMFGMLDAYSEKHPVPKNKSVEQTQLLAEVMRRAYRDRAEYLGDPDYVAIPEKLTQTPYIEALAQNIQPGKATSNSELKAVIPPKQGTDTTHYSVLDKEGNRVSATLSINLPFGSAYTDPGTGLLLNNEMDDFSSQPGIPNAYGLVATEANAIEAGKRPLSSMTPTFVESDESVAILGTPGGSRIITMVFLGLMEHLHDQPVSDWVSRKRFHHQYLPDVIQHEPDTFTEEEQDILKSYGYTLKSVGRTYGNMQAILWDKEEKAVTAASDPRRIGEASVQ